MGRVGFGGEVGCLSGVAMLRWILVMAGVCAVGGLRYGEEVAFHRGDQVSVHVRGSVNDSVGCCR